MMRTTILAALLTLFALSMFAETPETVVVTYVPQPGKAAEVQQLILEHWATLKRLDLVTADPHLLYRDGDKFVDVLTWKSGDIPDNAPPDVLAIWKKMNAAVVKDGIQFHEVALVHQ
jgi:hypothetical protein